MSIFAICAVATTAFAQNTAIPHGTIYGSKPNTSEVIQAPKLEAFMDKKTRISTTIEGKVLKVTKTKGGWFDIDAGNGKIIAAHFSTYDVTIPMSLAGHTVFADGVAAKEFTADESQHMAGSAGGTPTTASKLTFEVKGLMVA